MPRIHTRKEGQLRKELRGLLEENNGAREDDVTKIEAGNIPSLKRHRHEEKIFS